MRGERNMTGGGGNGVCLLDLGNTRYKWVARDRLESDGPRGSRYAGQDAAAALCRDVLARCDCRHWLVASVRSPSFNRELERRFLEAGGASIRFVTIPDEPPFALAYRDTGRFGIDRYLDLLAARSAYPLPSIVIDAGTAVTADALDSHGDHVGGMIFPGLALLRRALGQGTDRVGEVAAPARAPLGTSTEACVAAGIHHGFVGALLTMADSLAQALGGRATIVVTGGDADAVAAALRDHRPIVDTRLLFTGMTRT